MVEWGSHVSGILSGSYAVKRKQGVSSPKREVRTKERVSRSALSLLFVFSRLIFVKHLLLAEHCTMHESVTSFNDK